MGLSKEWTLTDLESTIRVAADALSPEKLQSETIRKMLNLALADVAEQLSGAAQPDYGEKASLSLVGNIADISTMKIDKIIKITDATNGLVVSKGDTDFESIGNSTDNKYGVFYNWFGTNIYFYKGSEVSAYGAITIYYYRQPAALAKGSSETIDIKDKYVPLVLAKAQNLIYGILGMQTPESLTALIQQQTASIRQGNADENALIQARKKTN